MTDLEILAIKLEQLGCPTNRSSVMAAQLERRAGQLAEKTGRPYPAALSHLVDLMSQGWAANPKADAGQ